MAVWYSLATSALPFCSTVERVIDPTRQGAASLEPEPSHVERMHPPVPLDEAMAIIESWAPGYAPFRGFAISRTLYQEVVRQRAECEALQAAHDKLAYQARAMGTALVDQPDAYGARTEHYPLSRCLDLMDVWREDVERWGLHQMCRVLRAAYEEATGSYQKESDNADRLHYHVQRIGREADRLQEGALAAIPCSAGMDNCHAPYHRHSPCCNLRVALWPGEEFPTDYLPDEGFIHLFEPGRGDAPRISAGCVRLIEPTMLGWLDALTEYGAEDVPDSILEAGNRPMQGGPVV